MGGAFYDWVSYFHAGGIDKPLLITKEGVESVVPRETWRGQFHAGTSLTTGARARLRRRRRERVLADRLAGAADERAARVGGRAAGHPHVVGRAGGRDA
jgi:hypothetical protein